MVVEEAVDLLLGYDFQCYTMDEESDRVDDAINTVCRAAMKYEENI